MAIPATASAGTRWVSQPVELDNVELVRVVKVGPFMPGGGVVFPPMSVTDVEGSLLDDVEEDSVGVGGGDTTVVGGDPTDPGENSTGVDAFSVDEAMAEVPYPVVELSIIVSKTGAVNIVEREMTGMRANDAKRTSSGEPNRTQGKLSPPDWNEKATLKTTRVRHSGAGWTNGGKWLFSQASGSGPQGGEVDTSQAEVPMEGKGIGGGPLLKNPKFIEAEPFISTGICDETQVLIKMAGKLVIGVDLGMTFTGVAYSTQNMVRPNVIQSWPGKSGQVENKVPTIVTYTDNSVSSWGFLCQSDDDYLPNKQTRQWFKLFLDPRVLRDFSNQPDVPRIAAEDVKRWYLDFLQKLYQHIETTMLSKVRRAVWMGEVEFIFSVPTTWTRQGMIEDYKDIIRRAGFGEGGNSHTVDIGLTEAEAAAVSTAKGSVNAFARGDTLLICDAGGGTTYTLLEPSVDVGSTKIDEEFEGSVAQRLGALSGHVSFDSDAASKMTRGQFQAFKCAFGPEGDFPTYSIRVPGITPYDYTNESLRVVRGKMYFARFVHLRFPMFCSSGEELTGENRTELQNIFDTQVRRIFRLIDKQLQQMATKMPEKQISFLVLSGGLGSSSYVQQCLRTRYITSHSPPSNAQRMEILLSDEPQLAVARGLVMDRIQKLTLGQSIMETRCCRASYGMVCMELYNSTKHIGMETWTDPLDQKMYVKEQIDWFVKKGQPVHTDHLIEHQFTRKIESGRPRETWKTRLVSCNADSAFLPTTFHPNRSTGATLLCVLESDLTHLPLTCFKKKNRHWYNRGKVYHRANYSVRVVIGSADIRFELWMDRVKYSKDRPIKVEWGPAEKGEVEVGGNEGVRWESY
ncbi:hypothetical protein FGG08_000500 [Glutinoglossum americanum]|uniref:Uncharacterized protein n=1 Tax=Glutinoglossum americanum TaxID=1670608 RepID=A0A9P8I8Q5_9PEZI|nr:hypothetical protein FGG08_000500 [Glutinoglossum americanum]